MRIFTKQNALLLVVCGVYIAGDLFAFKYGYSCSNKTLLEKIAVLASETFFFLVVFAMIAKKLLEVFLMFRKPNIGKRREHVLFGNQFHQCSFAGPDAQIMRDNLIANQEETVQIFRKVIFKWEQTNHSSPKSGNRAIIPEISPRPCRVIFSDDFLKKEMTTSREGTDWDKMFYVVDVSATKALGKVVSFKILEVYLDESFPIEETED